MKTYSDLYKSEIAGFKKLMVQFMDGELTVPEFKKKSGGFGVYAQRGKNGFMIRLRTPCGLISCEHLKLMQKYMHQYELDSIHLTSRQAVQLHNLSLDAVCDIMMDAIDYDLFTRGGGGNYPRNVALSPMSGVEKGEAFDVTDFAMQVSEYFVAHASEYHLPRKLKVAFSNGANDTACATINDIGFVAVLENNKPMFRVFLAGGMGNNPEVSIPYDKLIEPWEAMYYVEAYVRTYIDLGNYKNHARARSRYIPKDVGMEKFLETFESHVARVKKTENFEKIEATIVPEERWESD
ncbi:MAG: nitrite/sulfite reductase, partial [Clostridiales bacterium]|nr:nitrite/sulfite reductase [Clostridiales bacterium]